MKVIGKERIYQLSRTDDSVCSWIRAWVSELSDANWKQPLDVSLQYPNSRHSDDGYFIFPIGNSDKEIYLQIAFQHNIAVIADLH